MPKIVKLGMVVGSAKAPESALRSDFSGELVYMNECMYGVYVFRHFISVLQKMCNI